MEEILRESLHKDEKLLWSGQPESFETLDVTHKKDFVVRAVIAAVIAVVLVSLYIYMALKNNTDIKPFVVAILLIASAFSPLCTFTDASKLRKGVLYAITDRRLIVIRDSVKAVEYDRIKEAALKMDSDGHMTLLCGKRALKVKPTKWRGVTLVGESTADLEQESCESFALYALPEAERLKAVLEEHLPVLA